MTERVRQIKHNCWHSPRHLLQQLRCILLKGAFRLLRSQRNLRHANRISNQLTINIYLLLKVGTSCYHYRYLFIYHLFICLSIYFLNINNEQQMQLLSFWFWSSITRGWLETRFYGTRPAAVLQIPQPQQQQQQFGSHLFQLHLPWLSSFMLVNV